MKAIRVHQFGGPEVLRVEATADLSPGLDEIVVDIKAAGINPVDTYVRSGTYNPQQPLPYTPGFDGAGLIRAIGQHVSGHTVGERVYISGCRTGTYAEQTACHQDQIFPLPSPACWLFGHQFLLYRADQK